MSSTVLIADDHVMVREGLKSLLHQQELRVVGEASDGHAAVQLAGQLQPDVAVVDLAMPLLNGLDAAREILRLSPRTRVILLTMHTNDEYLLSALRAGVRAYVLKSQAASCLVEAIQETLRGNFYLSAGVSQALVDAYLSQPISAADALSVRERQVLQLVAEGKSNKDIANLLNVSVKTVESCRSRMMQKLKIGDAASLVRYAIRHGLIQL